MQTIRNERSLTLTIRMSLVLVMLASVAACKSDTSYDRHNLSRVWLSQDGKQLFFDATASTAYPADNAAAEAVRLGWMADWLKLRKFCTGGHRVADRRPIRSDEYNPQRHDLRYRIECL